MNPFTVHRHVFHPQISPISSISSILLYKFPDPVPEQMLLRLIRLPPHTRFLPRVHLADPYMRRTVEAAAVEGALPQRRPELLPPCHILPMAEHMLVEEQHTSRFEQVAHQRADGLARVSDGAQGEDGDDRVCATRACASAWAGTTPRNQSEWQGEGWRTGCGRRRRTYCRLRRRPGSVLELQDVRYVSWISLFVDLPVLTSRSSISLHHSLLWR